MTESKFPDDIDPQSGYRLPLPDRDGLDDVARAIYDYFADPKSGSYVGLWGPGGIRLHSPRVAEHTQSINRYIRREAGIDPRLREIAILATARELDSQFEWTAHEPEALERGVPQDTIDIIKYRRALDTLPDIDALVIRLGREIFGDRRVTPDTFARARDHFGPRGLVDFVTLMANYAATAALLTAFDMQLKPGWTPLLPVADRADATAGAGAPIRRVVTGHDDNGTAVVAIDGPAANARVRAAGGLTSTLIWLEDRTPADNSGAVDRGDRQTGVAPPDCGSIFRVVEFPPESTVSQPFSNEAMKAEMGLAADDGAPARHPSMHRTRSTDYAIVMSGEIDMLLDDSEVHLGAGDVIVQRGTNHAWVNRGDRPCRIGFVLIDAEPLPP